MEKDPLASIREQNMGPHASQRRKPLAVAFWLLGLFLYAAVALALGRERVTPAEIPVNQGFSLVDRLDKAQVGVMRNGKETACAWVANQHRFVCGGEAWAFVGIYAGMADGQSLRCVWMHPHGGGATTIMRWAKERIGNRAVGRLVLLDDVGPGADVRLKLSIDGQTIATAKTADSREVGEFDQPIPFGAAYGEVRLELSAADHGWRLACAELRTKGAREASKTAADPAGPASNAEVVAPRGRNPMLPLAPTAEAAP